MDSSFSSAIQPILKFLQLCGLDFQQDGLSRTNRILSQIYSALCLMVNVGSNSYVAIRSVYFYGSMTLSNVNTYIDLFNLMLEYIGSHLSMYCLVSLKSFSEFRHDVHRLERLLDHDAQHYRKLRHSSWMATSLIVAFVMTQTALTLYDSGRTSLVQLASSVLTDLYCVYPMTSYSLFYLSASALAASFQNVDSILSSHLRRESKVLADGVALAEIRSIHGLVCQAADRLNDTFQALSLIHVVFVFTGVVNTSFMMITQPHFNLKVFLYQLESVTRLCLLGYVSDRVQNKALASLKTLATVKSECIHSLLHQQQQVLLGTQVFQTIPKFDVYGLFQLSRQLLPTLIATTITYSVILYQFRSA